MKKAFVCSLVYYGLVGGMLYLDQHAVSYKTNKLAISDKYKQFQLPFKDIEDMQWQNGIIPIAVFHMRNNEIYKFLIFNKSSFMKSYQEFNQL